MRRSAAVRSAILAASCLAAVGCSSQDSRLASYRLNPTPELDTLHERHDDIDNALTITNDTNLRSMNQAIGRVLMLDRPMRLTREPMPH